jgi:hypothetical protein
MFNCSLAALIVKRLQEAGSSRSGLLPWRRQDPPPSATHFSEMVSVPSARKRVSVLYKRPRNPTQEVGALPRLEKLSQFIAYVARTFVNFTTFYYVRFYVLTEVVIKSYIFWDITVFSLLKVNRRFGGT